MSSHKELAKSYFLEGYNCAQAVVLAFHEELGLDKSCCLYGVLFRRRHGPPAGGLRHCKRHAYGFRAAKGLL